MKEHWKWLLARGAGLIELQPSILSFLEHCADDKLALPIPNRFETRLIHKSAREYLLNTSHGRQILDQDTRKLQHRWLDVIDALIATTIFSIVYKTNVFNYFEWGIPSLLPENITTHACSSLMGLLAFHAVMGHINTDTELMLLNDFAKSVCTLKQHWRLQFPIMMCAAAYGTSNYLSQNFGLKFEKMTADERNTILFSACDSFQIHMRMSEAIPADRGEYMELENCNIFAIKMIKRSIASIKYLLLANASPDAIFASRVYGRPKSTTPFLTFLHQLFLSISDLARKDSYPDGLWKNEIYANELKCLYLEIGACINIFTNYSRLSDKVILDDIDHGHFCLITNPRYPDPKIIFEISTHWFVEFFQARRAFFENISQGTETPGIHDRSQYVKCIALGRTQEAGFWNPSNRVENSEILGLEKAFESLLWNRASWRYQKDRLFPAENSELDKTFENLRDEVLDAIYF
jgi:hypothetical protein